MGVVGGGHIENYGCNGPADDPLVVAAQKNLAGLKSHIARKQHRAKAAASSAHDEV